MINWDDNIRKVQQALNLLEELKHDMMNAEDDPTIEAVCFTTQVAAAACLLTPIALIGAPEDFHPFRNVS